MTDVPVLQIEIDDSQYRAFVERVKQFRAEESEAPQAWAGTAEQIKVIQDRFEQMTEAASGQTKAAERTKSVAGSTLDTFGDAMTGLWSLARPSVRGVAKSISGATRDLARWERLQGGVFALLGTGGLLFGIDRLAERAAARRRSAAGLGVSTGELAAFQVNFGRLGNTDALAEGFNRAAVDQTARQPLFSLGVDARGKNATQLFAEALPHVKDLVDRTDPKFLDSAASAYHLDQLGFTPELLRLIRRLPRSEIEDMRRGARRDRELFDVPDDTGRKFQDLVNQLELAGARIGTALAGSLVNVAPGITAVSDSLVRVVNALLSRPEINLWIDRAAAGIDGFAARIGSKDARDALNKAVDRFKMTRDDFTKLDAWFSSHVTQIERLAAAVVGARVGSVLGPAGAAVGAVIGGSGFAPTHMEGDHAADEKQRRGGAAAERPTLEQRNAERRGLGDKPYVNQEEYDKAEPPVTTPPAAAPAAAPGSASAYDKDIAGDISSQSTYSRLGEKITPEAFVVHHTGSRGTPESIMATFNQRGFPAQYIEDRDGKIYRALPEGNRGAHILRSPTVGADGQNLSNDNTFGMEVIAKDDADVTPAQVAAARKFYKDLKAKYPTIQEAYGHGYLNPGHKQATEGKTIADAIHADEHAAPLPKITPAMAGEAAAKGVPLAQRGFLGGYAGGDAAHPNAKAAAPASRPGLTGLRAAAHPNAKPPATPVVHVTDNTGGSALVTVHH